MLIICVVRGITTRICGIILSMSKWDKVRLPREHDKRVKLTDDDRRTIRSLHADGCSIRSIATLFEDKCCRRTIQFVLFPERVKAARANRDWTKYVDRDKLTEHVRDIRARKKALFEKEIGLNENS